METTTGRRDAGGAGAGPIRLVDVDVHHAWRSIDDILPYLPRYWVNYIRETGFDALPAPIYHSVAGGGYLPAARPADGAPPGSDRALLCAQLLDRYGVDRAILTGSFITHAFVPNNSFSIALARAINDWTIDHWLAFDGRLRAALTVALHSPPAAVAEIDRLGDRPDIVGVVVPAGARLPYGNEAYHPIWEACERHNLPLLIDFGGTGMHLEAAPTAAGWPSHYLEWSADMAQAAMAQLVSLISEGVFEKFPGLRVALLECGTAWLPHLLWRFDKNWKALRSEIPWLKRPPSEYIRQHVRLSSQPLEWLPGDAALGRIFEIIDAERTVMFGSAYPRWDADLPDAAALAFPEALRPRLLAGNALEFFRLDGAAGGG